LIRCKTLSVAMKSLFPASLSKSSSKSSVASANQVPSRYTRRTASRVDLGILALNDEGVETDSHAIGLNKEVTDERVQALGIQVQRHEATIKDMSLCINGLKLEVQHEQHLRHASEQALRDEMSRSLRTVTEQVALRTDLAVTNASRGSSSTVAHGIRQQPVQDLAELRQDILAMVTELEGGAQQLAHQAAKQQIELTWPALEQQVRAVVTEVEGRAQDLARQTAAQQIELLLPTLEQQMYSQRASSSVESDDTSVLHGVGANPRLNSCEDQAQQLLRLEESMEDLRQRVHVRERESRPLQTISGQLPECLNRRGETP